MTACPVTSDSQTCLRVFFQDEGTPETLIPIPSAGDDGLRAFDADHELTLPDGETLKVYAEVSSATRPTNVLLTIQEGERMLDVRCGEFVVVGYQTAGDLYVLFQIGTGPWEQDE